MSAKLILDIGGCLFLLVFALQIFTTIKARGGLRGIRQVTRVSLRGVKALLLIGGVLALVSAICQPLLVDLFPPFPPLLIIGASLLALNAACLPPTFLFLGASQEGGFSLASDLQYAVTPLKIMHLLDSRQAGPIVGEHLHQFEYRVTHDWQRAVRALSGLTPVIIVDIRVLTPNVYREVVQLIEARLHNRVFLVVDAAHAPAAISRLCHQSGVRICVVTSELLQGALRGIGWTLITCHVGDIHRFIELRMLSIAAGGRHGRSEDKLCDWMMRNLNKGLTPDQIAAHVQTCPVCGPAMGSRRKQRSQSSGAKVDPEKFPTILVIGIDGPFNLRQILSMARRKNRELVVMGNRSPAFKDHELLLREASKFRSDPSLVLIFEKYPSKNDPLCLDPLVMVRRSFLLDVGGRLQAGTLGELAILMTMEAAKRNMKVSYV
jgi:hypothetical protein